MQKYIKTQHIEKPYKNNINILTDNKEYLGISGNTKSENMKFN